MLSAVYRFLCTMISWTRQIYTTAVLNFVSVTAINCAIFEVIISVNRNKGR